MFDDKYLLLFYLRYFPVIVIKSNVFWKGKTASKSAWVMFPFSKGARIPPELARASLDISVNCDSDNWVSTQHLRCDRQDTTLRVTVADIS